MRRADNTEQIIKENLSFTASAAMHDRILNDVLTAQEQAKKTKSGLAQANLWRTVMKSPLTKLATAAIVAIACLIGLSLWRGTESGIALAEVLARIEKVKAVRYRWIVKITFEDPNNPYNYEGGATELISQEYGSKSSNSYEKVDPNVRESTFIERPDPNVGESASAEYFLPQKKTRIYISHEEKKYTRTELDDAQVEQIQKRQNYRIDPVRYVKEILKYKYESLGRSTIDGIEVEGFRTTDPNYESRGKQKEPSQVDVKIWVDVKTQLPVRYGYEHFMQMGDNKKDHTRIVFYDFQWDVPVDAAVFEPPIPDGYTVTVIKSPPNNEETAIQGLKLWVELFGKYPERTLDVWQRVQRLVLGAKEVYETLAAERLQEEIKGLTEEEIKNKLLMPIRGLERFGCGLEWDKKDPAYYGKIVTPKDVDKVLLRWKVSDNEYRVIFGDLHAETVTPAKLADLEAALPK